MKYFTIFLFLYCSLKSQGQDTIVLANPSFETDVPACGNLPAFWIDRSESRSIQGSIQPGCYNVSTPAYHGTGYLSLLTNTGYRGNGRVGQKLPQDAILKKGSTYRMSIYLAFSKEMEFVRNTTPAPFNIAYDEPVVLRLIGYNTRVNRREILKETYLIDHEDWEAYDFEFKPEKFDYDELDLEAGYNPKKTRGYYGNILIDSLSSIIRVKKGIEPGTETKSPTALENPSFEGEPECCTVPEGWFDCGEKGESPPDIQPGSFKVTLEAFEGNTYLGLVVRDNDTWESIGQGLPEALVAGKSYLLKAHLARAPLYLSLSRSTGEEVNYATPLVLRVWGASDYCNKRELLAQSAPVTNTEWQAYELTLTTQKNDINFLILEAYYKTPNPFPYNGNLLIDNLTFNILSTDK